MGSLNTQGEVLKEILRAHYVDVAFVQEHRVPVEAQARVRRDFRAAGWAIFFGPARSCGFGEAILVHSRLSATPLCDADQICSVGILLHGGVLARLGNVYAPVAAHGNQAQYFLGLAQWMDLPGIWLAAGDFNTNLADEVPVEGRLSYPDTGTWRLSVHHDWHNPIDGFVGSASLIPGRAKSLGDQVLSQHAPVLCDVPCANALADRIAWCIPSTVTMAWTSSLIEEFRAHVAAGRSDLAWQLWRYMAFGLDGEEVLFKPARCAVLSATGQDGRELRSLMASTRRLSRRAASEWTSAEHAAFESLEKQLSDFAQARRRKLISAWKARMRDVGCAARWVRASFASTMALKKADGTPATSPKEQGEVIANEWRPRWTEIPEARFQKNRHELQAVCNAFGRRVPPCPQPPHWSVRDIRQECRNTAAGIDGLSFGQFAGLPELHLSLLGEFYDALDAGMNFPSCWTQARLVCIAKEDGGARPITILAVAYRIWSARMARHLAKWADSFFPAELVGGRSKAPPAGVTANLVSTHLACARAEGSSLAGACLDTIKCFDSVSLLSLRVLLEACGAPPCLFAVLQLWQGLERHIWTADGPTGCTVRISRQRGLPQGDAIAPWALNLVMGAWLQNLPTLDLVRVYLDDRCLVDASPAHVAQALARTQSFDRLFGMETHPRKSVRFQIGHPSCREAACWLALPERSVIKYLGVALETTLAAGFELGDRRAKTVKARILRARALPEHDTRRGLLPAYLQGLYSEGVGLSKRATDSLSTAVCQAFWGPTLHVRNWMRSNAYTLGLLGPLHRLAPSAVQLHGALIGLGRLVQWQLALVQRLWHVLQQGTKFSGFAGILHRALEALSWSWPRPTVLQTSEAQVIRLDRLTASGVQGEQARHALRHGLRQWWWRAWDASRPAHEGIALGVDRTSTLQPLLAMRTERSDFGWDGSLRGARYARFLADALWSRFRLWKAKLVQSARCRRCGLEDEHLLHLLWSCPANEARLRQLRLEWAAGAEHDSRFSAEEVPQNLPNCLRQCGIVPKDRGGCSSVQVRALQRYFVDVLQAWGRDRGADLTACASDAE